MTAQILNVNKNSESKGKAVNAVLSTASSTDGFTDKPMGKLQITHHCNS